MEGPLHCPVCQALVVDRRFAACTTCHAPLPPGWVLSREQVQKLEIQDQHARREHAGLMDQLDPANDPNDPTAIDPDI
jgi:hypothetical protein